MGTNYVGAIFKFTTNGDLSLLYTFGQYDTNGNEIDGNDPGGLIQKSDGYLYGTASSGGTNAYGTFFKCSTNGDFTLLYNFGQYDTYGNEIDGTYPTAPLTPNTDGFLYGTANEGGTNDSGTVFKFSTNGGFTLLYTFGHYDADFNELDGSSPGPLALGDDGFLYGAASSGGTNEAGTLFKLSTSGQFTLLYTFTNGLDGSSPDGLTLGEDGALYGTSSYGGTNGYGTIFKMSTAGEFTLLYTFTNGMDGSEPASLTLGNDGRLYGPVYFGGAGGVGDVFAIAANGAFSPVYSFPGSPNGYYPTGPLAQGPDGNFYGTTTGGGPQGGGVIFRLTPGGTYSVLDTFANNQGYLLHPLALGLDGALYGANGESIFKLTTSGAYTPVYRFTNSHYGFGPSTLTLGNDGSFYGPTTSGGDATRSYGTIFKVTTNGILTSLYTFLNGVDGANPLPPLAQGSDGRFYGGCLNGGSGHRGTLFAITTDGALTPLFGFPGPKNPQTILTGLASGPGGAIYGATEFGTNLLGSFFKMTTNGVYSLLHAFTKQDAVDVGIDPRCLIAGANGALYATTSSAIVQLSTNGVVTPVYSFTNGVDGTAPFGLSVAGDGSLYGAANGGPGGGGVLFRLAFANAQPVFQSLGRAGSGWALTWSTVPGVGYQLQFKGALSALNWTNLGGAITSMTSSVTVTDTVGVAQRFYRVSVP